MSLSIDKLSNKISYLFSVLILFFGLAVAGATPNFGDYPVRDVSDKRVEFIDVKSHPKAKHFKTRLSKAIGKSANFAGHFVVLTWGCGSFCQVVAMVDVNSGRVHFSPFSTSLGAEFRLDSTLFVDSPKSAISELPASDRNEQLFHSRYYVWIEDENMFQFLYED